MPIIIVPSQHPSTTSYMTIDDSNSRYCMINVYIIGQIDTIVMIVFPAVTLYIACLQTCPVQFT